jgi:hypothetical protein
MNMLACTGVNPADANTARHGRQLLRHIDRRAVAPDDALLDGRLDQELAGRRWT